jgi:hypothetical protein
MKPVDRLADPLVSLSYSRTPAVGWKITHNYAASPDLPFQAITHIFQ